MKIVGLCGIDFAQLLLCALLVFVGSQNAGLCATDPLEQGAGTTKLLLDLRYSIESKDTSRTEEICRELSALGSKAVPAIRDAFRESDDNTQAYLVRAVSGIDGDAATKLLVEMMDQAISIQTRMRAFSTLENRPINFVLTQGQLGFLLNNVREGNIISSGGAARVLSRCEHNDKAGMIQPILQRFMDELASPSELSPIHGSYVSPHVYVLNQFLLAFLNLRADAVPLVKSAWETAQAPEMRKWLTLALGMAGEPSVVPEIRGLIEHDPDVSFRCVAVRAYARSAGEKSIPFLETLLFDNAQSEYDRLPDETPVYPVRIVARDELVELRNVPRLEKVQNAP